MSNRALYERGNHIARYISAYLQQNKSVPWYEVSSKYRLSQSAINRILDARGIDVEKRKKMIDAVTQLADKKHDAALGRSDWEAVAETLDVSLIDGLWLFDEAASTVTMRQKPSIDDWSTDDLDVLKSFVASNFVNQEREEWRLVGNYMNIRPADCCHAYRTFTRQIMTHDLFAAVGARVKQRQSWNEIHERFPIFNDSEHLRKVYYSTRHSPERIEQMVDRTRWTSSQNRYFRRIFQAKYRPGDEDDLAMTIATAMPDRSVEDIQNKIAHAAKMFSPPVKPQSREVETPDSELETGTDACPAAEAGAIASGMGGQNVDPQLAAQTAAVNREVTRMIQLRGRVFWDRVCEAVGLTEIACMELCQVNEGKERWVYDPKTFARGKAVRMAEFIRSHYPGPEPPNFHAVSNYMWTDMRDCEEMLRLWRGQIEWTREAKDDIVEMRKQHVPFSAIAHRISPNFTPQMARDLYAAHTNKPGPRPLTRDDKTRIKALVDENAQTKQYRDVCDIVKQELGGDNWCNVLNFLDAYTKTQPVYKARLESRPPAALVATILSGGKNIGDLARKLNVSPVILNEYIRHHQYRAFPRKWTQAETDKLVNYLDQHGPPSGWTKLATQLATKTAKQCQKKYHELKKAGLV